MTMQTIYLVTITRDHDFCSVATRKAFTSRNVGLHWSIEYVAAAIAADTAHDPSFDAYGYSTQINAIDLNEEAPIVSD